MSLILQKKKKIENNSNLFDANMKLEDFFKKTNIDFRNENAETLNGIINLAIGRIARKNERITYKNINFEITNANDRVVKTVRLLN